MAAPVNDPRVDNALPLFYHPVLRDENMPGWAYSFKLATWVPDPLGDMADEAHSVPLVSPEEVAAAAILFPGHNFLPEEVAAAAILFPGHNPLPNHLDPGTLITPPVSDATLPSPPSPLPQAPPLGKYTCPYCHHPNTDNRRLNRHLEAQHGVQGVADTRKCVVEGCGYDGRSDNVRRHEKLRHGMHGGNGGNGQAGQ